MHEIYPILSPLPPAFMDKLLAQGFYRMGQSVFTTSATISDAGEFIIVLWARVLLNEYKPGKRHKELIRRNRRFQTTLHTARIDEEIETLYANYAAGVNFMAPETATSFLMGTAEQNNFPSRMWQMRDQGQLIAVGYFDEGVESAAGILNFYHPDYKKFSPGKFLYLEGVRYAAETGKHFFYPGYIAIDFRKFDYKLMAGKKRMEIWDINEAQWIPYHLSIHAQQFSDE